MTWAQFFSPGSPNSASIYPGEAYWGQHVHNKCITRKTTWKNAPKRDMMAVALVVHIIPCWYYKQKKEDSSVVCVHNDIIVHNIRNIIAENTKWSKSINCRIDMLKFWHFECFLKCDDNFYKIWSRFGLFSLLT